MRSHNSRDKRFGRGKKTRDGRAGTKRQPKQRHLRLNKVQFRTKDDLTVAKLLQRHGYTFKYNQGFEITGRKTEPKPAPIDGIQPCNELEARMINLLKRLNIPFEYSKRFETMDRFGRPNHREVDIWFAKPLRVYWIDEPVQALELKGGCLDDNCWHQKKELKDIGVKTWIVLPQYVDFWERHGFLRKDALHPRKKNK
ncbi:MAG: hypothetical protein HY225_01070 [Candidatus Vogelbacteria bacterium]|nr:hypothetical protein [Candidatus Vogelbacteria bacterium]